MKTISNEQCAMCNDQQPRKMKDSGIEWIGEIPEGWNLLRMKWCISKRDSGSWGTEPTGENDTICLRIADFDYARFAFQNKDVENLTKRHYSVDVVNELTLQKNDILIEKSGGGEKTPVGRTVIFDKDYVALFANFMDRLRCSDNILPKYMQYVFVTFYKNEYTRNYIKQTTGIQNLDLTSMLSQESVPLPPLHKQQAIAAHLDRICSEIDSVTAKTKATIEEYKKLKQAIITQAVTKGIRKGRKMKDSGVEWIGEIPEEWELRPFRHILKERNEKNYPIKSTERLSLSIELGVTLYSEKTTNLDRFKDDFEEYKLAHIGDLVMNSMNMIVGATGVSDYYGCVSPIYYTFYDENENHITAKFCEYIFRSKAMLRVLYSMGKGIYAIVRGDDRVNTCRLKVAKEDLKSLLLPIPSLDEQQEIIDYIYKKCAAIDTLIAKKEQLLTELENYKKSVIYEYVTGKKEMVDTSFVVINPLTEQALLLCKIKDYLGDELKGRIQALKCLYLIEIFIDINFNTQYFRYKHGPYTHNIENIEKCCMDNGWLTVSKDKHYQYHAGNNHRYYSDEYDSFFSAKNSDIEKVLSFLKGMKTSESERVATLFAVWNDMIIEGKQSPSDSEIIHEVRNNWTPNKANSPESTWQNTLDKMKKAGIIPKGYGLHTMKKENENE